MKTGRPTKAEVIAYLRASGKTRHHFAQYCRIAADCDVAVGLSPGVQIEQAEINDRVAVILQEAVWLIEEARPE